MVFILVGVWLGLLPALYKVMYPLFQACCNKFTQLKKKLFPPRPPPTEPEPDLEPGLLTNSPPLGAEASAEVPASPTEG